MLLTFLCPDLISSHTLHSPRASEEGPLLYGAADAPADHPVCVRDVSSALHEDGLPPPDDPAGPCQVRRARPTGGRAAPWKPTHCCNVCIEFTVYWPRFVLDMKFSLVLETGR